jgi:hypothetical protein
MEVGQFALTFMGRPTCWKSFLSSAFHGNAHLVKKLTTPLVFRTEHPAQGKKEQALLYTKHGN